MMVNESSPICHNYANVHFGEFRPFLQKSLSSNQENSIKNLKEKCQINIDFNLFSQVIVAFGTVKDTTVHYGGIVVGKSSDLILDGVDLAGEGYAVVQPYVQKAVDGTKDTLGPIFGPTLGPYWAAFSTHVANSYAESHKLARGKYFLLHLFNRSSRRKRGMASNPLFIIPGFSLHFPKELGYGYLTPC